MILKFWGIRGSIPVPGEKTVKYGGNTPCVQLITNENIIILDAGTGIRELGLNLVKEDDHKNLCILITHNHWDHIQGIPFFLPFFRKDYSVCIYSNTIGGLEAESVVDALMNPNFFPVDKEIFKASLKYIHIIPGKQFSVGNTVIDSMTVNHSKGTVAFKISEEGKTVVYMTDNEIKYEMKSSKIDIDSISSMNSNLINFCKGCDYLIHDSMYTMKDFINKKNWGHSNNISAAYFSMIASVKNLLLFHFDPEYTDDEIDKIQDETIKIFKINNSKINCLASRERLVLEI